MVVGVFSFLVEVGGMGRGFLDTNDFPKSLLTVSGPNVECRDVECLNVDNICLDVDNICLPVETAGLVVDNL